jgi:restriction system protein
MGRWNDPHIKNEREWQEVKSSLRQIRSELEKYSYDPNESIVNKTYDLIESKNYFYEKLSINTLTFILPKIFVTLSLNELLTPLAPPDLPQLPELPPLEPPSAPDWYKKRDKKDFSFRDEKWIEKARQKLETVNFNTQEVSWEEMHLIENLVITDESVEVASMIEKVRAAGLVKLSEAKIQLEALKSSLNINDPKSSICRLIELAHKRHYLPPFLKKNFSVAINTASKVLLIQFEFPDFNSVHLSYAFLKNGNAKFLNPTQKKKVIKNCMYSLIVRAGHLASRLNLDRNFESIVVNVEQNWFDPATGQPRNGVIASVQGPVEYFKELDLSKLDPEACFKSLKGLSTPSLENISPIRPIFILNKEDERFIQSKDIEDSAIPEANLAAMEWEDFEHLVAQLFEWEFGRNGVEVKVTRASRDRGVDAVLFDPDPLRGGKFVLQAKRYTRTVDVSSVRDLYGTVVNEGANRGILITTASFGPDSYEFAKDKPISLVDGPNLLNMLQRHGKKFRIDLDEARVLNNS